MKYTKEQNDIINSEETNIIINAVAGSGKTSTLIAFTKKRPLNSFLYLAYNNSIKKEAKKKFFGNTDVHTIHSLAYKEIGYIFENKLTSNLKIINIIKNIDYLNKEYLKDKTNQDIYIIGNSVLNFLNYYFSSKILDLEELDFEYKELAIEYWNKMQDINNISVKMTHDGYLKLYHFLNPELKYDYIMVDEAQDSNDIMLDIIINQNTNKIFVGDEYQEIYGFRYINNIYKNDLFKDYKKYYLSESFRFGENISFIANFILNKYKKEFIKIKGNNKDSLMFEDFSDNEKITIITRTNAYLFDIAVNYLIKNKKIFIIGGENFLFKELEDCYNLYHGNLYKIENIHIKQFGNFNKLKIIAKKTMDLELLYLSKIVEKYSSNLLDYIEKLKKNLVRKESFADITLTTAHKSKGLEFFNVKIGEDFYPLFSKTGQLKNINMIPYEEINIYYVAITRTIEKIQLNNDIINLISTK
jgi:superfamily I DNA/RNA helicase